MALHARALLGFPPGANASDTVLAGVHFNRTVLSFWNYTLYTNGTLSNGSNCYVVESPYTPVGLLPNGSFVNSTWCYDPINPIGPRAGVGVGFGVVYGLALVLVLACLTKHGRSHLPVSKRFYPVGRRWQWYYAILVCVAAFISLFTNIDVDRFYVVGLPIVINSFFWYLLQQFTMALVWEAVRHWGSWSERQAIDPDPFSLREGDRRSKVEFWAPLWFYFWLWLNFFLIIPRNWGEIEKQRSPDQTASRAAPNATDARFKAATFCLVVCWLTIVASLRHSIKHYYPRNRGLLNKARGFLRYVPLRFLLIIPLAACLVAYQGIVSWNFAYSVLNAKASLAPVYAGGYGPALLILYIQIAYGFLSPNEDKELIRQRRERGAQIDREMGYVPKPAWWKRAKNDDHLVGRMSMRERIARNVRELGGGAATNRGVHQNIDAMAEEREQRERADDEIEMGPVSRGNTTATASAAPVPVRPGFDAAQGSTFASYSGKSDRRRNERAMAAAADLLFPVAGASRPDRTSELTQDGPPPSYTDVPVTRGRGGRTDGVNAPHDPSQRSNSTSTAVSITGQQPQQVKSMLDI
ncbi:hypothetical protein CGRA01v4_04461 [Colletotrichum graminicola]|uniref:DUF2434 domain-containing protein n=1 Tax=Colletotrichum graminicola (strain M1.001 / M2 / FGSC 10212) TaxID=645133 RepID=E3Q8M2_COLGM|nr:uncharacterized protein GLRG_01881 [Colletotrichum graminicola M1.001]EFQ27386.1 hypothetical protein GLRG_01881 [Colletotrichum graminicola M1.001]WDK13180.1 hypothetical protein CGRA01v4_04461 [Colletotrichum graminicola]